MGVPAQDIDQNVGQMGELLWTMTLRGSMKAEPLWRVAAKWKAGFSFLFGQWCQAGEKTDVFQSHEDQTFSWGLRHEENPRKWKGEPQGKVTAGVFRDRGKRLVDCGTG